ncbi:MAG: anthranilate synthase component I family protein [Candidatus Methanogranum gryphiswaldense]|nr:MAG: anthranilate synthase component I family protein [Candidatus Methanogranum sp. U3.2.1]
MIRKRLDAYVPIIDIYSRIDRQNTVFLDSSMRNDLGRFSFIGLIPYRTIVFQDFTKVDGTMKGTTFLDEMDNEIGSCDRSPAFADCLMGYISYDHGSSIMGIRSEYNKNNVPECVLIRFDVVIVEDHLNKTTEVFCNGRVKDPDSEIDHIMGIISSVGDHTIPRGKGYRLVSDVKKQDYLRSIMKAKELMIDGEMYVMNMTHTMEVRSDSDPFGTFLRLRKISPSPFGAYMDIEGIQIISSSMELLAEIKDNRIRTRPIKGTVPKTGDPQTDAENLKKLRSSDKERSELLMISDLERNDLNRFCVPGSVKVEGFMIPEEYSTVFHTVSEISGIVREGVTVGEIVSCMFPGGSVTGAPKQNAMKYIDDLEDRRRGIYTGTICILSPGRSTMNIAIRTMVHKDGAYTIGVGGGITFESDPEEEYMETLQKAKAMLESLE